MGKRFHLKTVLMLQISVAVYTKHLPTLECIKTITDTNVTMAQGGQNSYESIIIIITINKNFLINF